MCKRLGWIVENGFKWSWPRAANELGYETTATIYQVRAGKRFPDITKLAALAKKSTHDGRKPNIDWIVTGRGAPLIGASRNSTQSALFSRFEALPASYQKAVRALVIALTNSG